MKAELPHHDTTHEPRTPEPPAEAPRCLSDVLRHGLDVKLHLLMHYAELARPGANE
ncbi:hypothetical protein GQ464_010665 [Rhodocaloribacter litoris]|uniref:hypothetical protein n=1 Tax=Rhodocaloribacter litoris TaxID=2558931 RepID=UPI001E627B30|nr:hypothetical protein [Rhodocaloribacter litoris]QXD13923.1 hypothetical protein GQ464_010665 [Rhodocaloribacter litoris]